MPLPKRVVMPVHVARGTLPEDYPLPSELEGVTNGTLANTVRQLSSLSRHAEDLFGELARDAQEIYDRSNSLQARIDRLAIKVTQLDSTGEEVSLQDIHMRKAFKSAVIFDQHIFSRSTMPTALLEMYKTCDRPPPLDKLNCYREDGKDGLKFYTDPNYFFELWRDEVLKDTERVMHDRGKKPHRPRPESGQGGGRHKKRVRQPVNTKERQRERAIGHGEYIMPSTVPYGQFPVQDYGNKVEQNQQWEQQKPSRPISIDVQKTYLQPEVPDGPVYPPQYVETTNPYQAGLYNSGPPDSPGPMGTPTKVNKIRPSQPPPAPPSNPQTPSANTPTRSRSMSSKDLPPPPPPPEATISPPNGLPPHIARQSSQSRSNSPHSHQGTPEPDLPPPPPVPKQASPPKQATPVVQAPPPPPPPPMPLLNGPGTMSPPTQFSNGDIVQMITSTPKLTPVKDRQISKQGPPVVDTRNDLLKAIRQGIQLRKVEKTEQKEVEHKNGLHDVASILARRVAVELSPSESDSDSDIDSDGWDENETSA
ncbi:actin-binding protein WASF3 [Onthophagus taurus]|uniref:actin-binding protein WASF3 n=1 Tax=Onthophagus taurus TaxID=166361 RepID=UPI000C20793B|nr:wiskott-Aldrich syndrome protein family member 3 [Onthophagus taurus]XP_022906757.1 wiskott-Aldrich syndrome protein family member 3 [Onthophagus taurus]